jgi:hypothetical protein
MNGLDLPATCLLLADFSRTTFDLDEHLDKNYQQNQSFAGANEWRLDAEKRKNPMRGARYFFPTRERLLLIPFKLKAKGHPARL